MTGCICPSLFLEEIRLKWCTSKVPRSRGVADQMCWDKGKHTAKIMDDSMLWSTNIAMENGPLIVDLPIKSGYFP